MNYANLLARGLLILYCIFLLLFAFGEGFLEGGFVHAIPVIIILAMMIMFREKHVLSSLIFFLLSVFSVWFFKTYNSLINFLIISAPLLVASVLFFFGRKFVSGGNKLEEN